MAVVFLLMLPDGPGGSIRMNGAAVQIRNFEPWRVKLCRENPMAFAPVCGANRNRAYFSNQPEAV
jgi:hypothetical protein